MFERNLNLNPLFPAANQFLSIKYARKSMEPMFVAGHPAIRIGKTLVVSDLHIGIEREFRKSGINLLSQTRRMLERLGRLIGMTGARKLVVIGDVKHKVPGASWQEEREIPAFFSSLLEKVSVEVVPGNHDDRIRDLVPPGVKIHPSEGFLFGESYLFHGHTWPGKDAVKARYIVTGHTQPQVEIRDSLGYRWVDPVWVKAYVSANKLGKKCRSETSDKELIIMPAFNEFAGGMPVNRKSEKRFISPVLRIADMEKSRVFLLDGTYLGTLSRIMAGSSSVTPSSAGEG